MRRIPIALLALAACVVWVPSAQATRDENTLVSRQSTADGGAGADGALSVGGSMSADGRYVVFASDADNLSPIDDNSVNNVYRRDTLTGSTLLISRQSAGDGGAAADDGSLYPTISADGRYVAFESEADNLSDNDTDVFFNVYLRDTATDTTSLVSVQGGLVNPDGGDDDSFVPAISANGRFVTFESQADDLSTVDDNSLLNVFVRDTAAATTTLVSRRSAADGGGTADGSSFTGAISADGRYVAFDSEAGNLSAADTGTDFDVYVRDTATDTTTLVSRQSAADGGLQGTGESQRPSISADGRYLSFESSADNLSTADNDAFRNIFLRDTLTDTTTLISRQSTADGAGGGTDESRGRSSVSADGRYVAFDSFADNLSTIDSDSLLNVFVRDTTAGTTTFVSRQSASDGGAPGDGDSEAAYLTPDGRYVAFSSIADNLSAADGNASYDVYQRDLLGDGVAPDLMAGAKKHQDLDKPIRVRVSCVAVPCDVEAGGSATPKGSAKPKRAKKVKFKPVGAGLQAGETRTLKLKPSKRGAHKLARARKAKARLFVTATDADGDQASTRLKVKLR